METITILKGPDRVRQRPAILFGSDGLDGAVAALRTLLDIFIAEAAVGQSAGIDVTLHGDDSVSVHSHDRGFLLEDTLVDGKPAWHRAFCELYMRPREELLPIQAHLLRNGLYGETVLPSPLYAPDTDPYFDLCCVQYASAFMQVEAIRDGMKKTLGFEKGYCTSPLTAAASDEPTGTRIRFAPDPAVFSAVRLPADAIAACLQEAAVTIPGLTCRLRDERDGKACTYHYPCGLRDYAAAAFSTALPFYEKALEAEGKDRYNKRPSTARVKLIVGFGENAPEPTCFHNYRTLAKGGQHLTAVKKQIHKHLNHRFDASYTLAEVADRLFIAVETACTANASVYADARRQALTNRMVADMAEDLVNEDFGYYLKQNHDAVAALLKRKR